MASSLVACCKSQCYGIETSQVNPSFVEPNFSCLWKIFYASIQHVKEYPTMRVFIVISRNSQSTWYMPLID